MSFTGCAITGVAHAVYFVTGVAHAIYFINSGIAHAAYLITGSVGLFSDALESGVNLLAAGTAYVSLWYSARPADPSHAFGHEKIEFFSAGLEGVLVAVAGLGTGWYAVQRMIHPAPLAALGGA